MGVATNRFSSFLRRVSTIGESHGPDCAAHQIHSQQSGNEESRCSASRARAGSKSLVSNRVDAACGFLDGAIGEHARGAALGVGVVVAIVDGAAGIRHGEQRYFAGAQSFFGSVRIEQLHVEQFFACRDCASSGVTVAISSTSAGRLRNAMPSPAARRMGNTKTQKRASGSRMNSRNRTIVSCTSGWSGERLPRGGFALGCASADIGNGCCFAHVVRSLIAQMASRQGDEDVLQRCGVRAQFGERNILPRQFGEQCGNSEVQVR